MHPYGDEMDIFHIYENKKDKIGYVMDLLYFYEGETDEIVYVTDK